MTRAPIDTCVVCGEPEAAHHEFEAVSVRRRHVARRELREGMMDPIDRCARCVCVFKRLTNVPPICERFKVYPLLKVTCKNCSHDEACHEVKR